MPESFTAKERDFIRTRFLISWGRVRSLREEFFLHGWAGGPNKGQPKLRTSVRSVLERGLVELIEPEGRLPLARFTAAGLEAL